MSEVETKPKRKYCYYTKIHHSTGVDQSINYTYLFRLFCVFMRTPHRRSYTINLQCYFLSSSSLPLLSLSAFLCILLCKFLLTMRTEAISHTCARLFVHHFDEECLFGAFWLRYKCCCHSSDGLCRCENSLVEHEPLIDATKSISSTYFRFFPFISISSAYNSF